MLRFLWEGEEEGWLTLDFDERLLLLKVSCKFMSNYNKILNRMYNFRIIKGKNQKKDKLFNFFFKR